MLRFVGGFLCASLLWGGAAVLYFYDLGDGFGPSDAPVADLAQPVAAATPTEAPQKRKGRKKRPGAGDPARQGSGTDSIGDDIGWDDDQAVDMAGGEEQLSGAAIEAGFDKAMPGIRRCLILVPADGDITGKLLFGMRVGGDGAPKAVNLTGPSVVTGGESGACLRRAAQSIRFPSFQGPDMVFKYPITLQ